MRREEHGKQGIELVFGGFSICALFLRNDAFYRLSTLGFAIGNKC